MSDTMNPCLFYKCMADDTRLKLILLIAIVGEACVCDLMCALDLDQPTTSRHLAHIRKNNIFVGDKRGKWVYYQMNAQLPSWASAVIEQTLQANPDYYADALDLLKASIKKTTASVFC